MNILQENHKNYTKIYKMDHMLFFHLGGQNNIVVNVSLIYKFQKRKQKISFILKTQTDVAINNYKGLLLSPTLLP